MTARPSSSVLVIALIAQLLMPIGVAGAGERAERREPRGAKVIRGEKAQRSAKAKSRQRRQQAPAASRAIAAAVGAQAARIDQADEFSATSDAVVGDIISVRKPRTATRVARAAAGRTVATEERPFYEFGGFAFGLDFGLTLSEYRIVRDPEQKGVEWIHVVNLDGRSNIETVLARWPLKKGKSRRIELQGPALNSNAGSDLPLGVRVLGVGLTDDLIDRDAREAVSYTFEVKASERMLAELAMLGVPLAATLLPTAGAVATRIAQAFVAAVPVVNVLFAANTAWRTWRVFATPTTSKDQRWMAVAHLGADVLRVFAPVAGTVVSVALVAAFGLRSYRKLRAYLPA